MNHFAGQGFATCFPNFAIGAFIRLDINLGDFNEDDFIGWLAVTTGAERSQVDILNTGVGSTVVYFYFRDPTIQDLDADSSDLAKLSGNERMLQLYSWYVTDDTMLDNAVYPILDMKVYARQTTTTDTETSTSFVVQLFGATSPMPDAIRPPRAFRTSENGEWVLVSGDQENVQQVTLEFQLTDAAPALEASLWRSMLMACGVALLMRLMLR